jgi:hypothetical protein
MELVAGPGSYLQAKQLMHAQSADEPAVGGLRVAIGLRHDVRGRGVVRVWEGIFVEVLEGTGRGRIEWEQR